MSNFTTKCFTKHDDYMTPKYVWEDIKDIIPKKKIWECFYGDGKSGEYLTELGFDVIHEKRDFFDEPPDQYDISISNPPFSKAKDVLTKLKEYNKPFIMILPCSKICTQYFRSIFKGDNIQIIIPKRRINFSKVEQIEQVEQVESKKQCNFDCFYYCWNMNFSKDLIWL